MPEQSFNEFDELLDKLREEGRLRAEKARAREVQIPDYLFHATLRSNVKIIEAEGLNPSPLLFAKNEGEDPDEVVSLSDNIGFALHTAMLTQHVSNPNDLVVLEINTLHLNPRGIRNYLRTADPTNPDPQEAAPIHEVHYAFSIDRTAYKVMKLKQPEIIELLAEST